MSVLTPLVIVNRAFARLGIDPLEDLLAETIGGQTAQLVYDAFVESCLGLYPWSFGRELRVLSPLTGAVSPYGFTRIFDLPGDRLGPPIRIADTATDPDCSFNRYVVAGEQVHADPAVLYAEVKILAPPSLWTAAFREAVVLGLAAELALAIVDDSNLRAALRGDTFGPPSMFPRGGLMGAAMQEDARATPPRRAPVDRNPLTRAWRS